MISRERFEQLATLTSAGEATAAERAEMEAALSSDPALMDELLETCVTDSALRRAVNSPAIPVEAMPPHVLEMLDQVRREALSSQLANTAAAAGTQNVVAFPLRSARKRSTPAWLAMAACLAVAAGIALFYLPARLNSKKIVVLAPRGETGITKPTLVWEATPDQRYDVWILPPEGSHLQAPALFTAKSVRPPLDFSELKPAPALADESRPTSRLEPGTDYRLLVCLADAGRVAGVAVPFRTASTAVKSLPPPTYEAAWRLADSGHPADALMLLTHLPLADREKPEARELERELRARLAKIPPSDTKAP